MTLFFDHNSLIDTRPFLFTCTLIETASIKIVFCFRSLSKLKICRSVLIVFEEVILFIIVFLLLQVVAVMEYLIACALLNDSGFLFILSIFLSFSRIICDCHGQAAPF